jgi:hypothetical protein
MKRSRRGLSPLLSVLSLILVSTGMQCTSISPFSPTAYQHATSLKVESLMLMDKATEPYASHEAEVEALKTKVDIAYEYANGRPKNEISA